MSTPASVANHPIHPILVGFPIGVWTFSVVADLIHHTGWGGPAWRAVAFYCVGAGIVAAVLAAVPGFIDLFSITDARVWRVGVFHMSANLLAVIVFALSFVLRWVGRVDFLPVGISIVGLIALGVAGWFGGELVFVHNMGVTPPRQAPRHSAASRHSSAGSRR